MTDLLKVLQDGDVAGIELEKAREGVEQAKAALDFAKEKFETAKLEFDEVAQRADEAGMAKAKFKKLIEERTAVLWSSGFVSAGRSEARSDEKTRTAKAPKSAKKSKESSVADSNEPEVNNVIDFENANETHDAFVN